MAFGITGSTTKTDAQSSQSVFEADIFKRLFAGASNVAGGIDTSGLSGAANNLFSSGTGFLGSLEDIAGGTDVAGQFLTEQISGESGLVDENISALSDDLGKFFDEQLLPGISSQAVGGGQLGGGRQGVAEGIAAEGVSREFRRGSLDIRNADLDRRTGAANTLTSNRLAASGAGIEGAGRQFDLANAAALAPLSPFLALADILGGPTTLSESTSKTRSKSLGFDVGAVAG